MKKVILLFLVILLVGCNYSNTPSLAVEGYLSKYQKLDSDVLNQLDVTLDSNNDMTKKQKEEYKALLQRQYQNLSYKIVDEKYKKNKATVDVEIEVFDYATEITKSKDYFNKHKEELVTEKDNEVEIYNNYMLKRLKTVTAKVNYQMVFKLSKKKNIWIVDSLTQEDREKIHGLYKEQLVN